MCKTKAARQAAKKTQINSAHSGIGLGNNPTDRQIRRENRAPSTLRQLPVRVWPDNSARAVLAQFLIYEGYMQDPYACEHAIRYARRTFVNTMNAKIALEDRSYPIAERVELVD